VALGSGAGPLAATAGLECDVAAVAGACERAAVARVDNITITPNKARPIFNFLSLFQI
jgi:hypothetical protein